MSRENVEVVRRAYEAWNTGDYTAFFAVMDPEIEFVLPEGGMNAKTHQGLGAVRQFMESYVESFENLQVVPEEFFETGDQVVAFIRLALRGRASGVEIQTPGAAHLLTLRGGKMRRLEVFPDREEALEAMGLRE